MASKAVKKVVERMANGELIPKVSKETKMKRDYVHYFSIGLNPTQAAAAAGSEHPNTAAMRMKHDPWVKEQLAAIHEADAKDKKMTRDKVQNILEDAIQIARIQAEPGDMIRGANELNKMMGFHSAQEIHHKIDGKVDVLHQQIQELSEIELLERIGKEQDPSATMFDDMDALDGDWEEVIPDDESEE